MLDDWGWTNLSVQHDHVLDVGVLYVILDTLVLANAAHGDTVGAVAVDVGDEDVRGVGLWREAVITNVNPGVAYSQAVHIVRIPAVSVLGQVLVCGQVLDDNVVVDNVLGGHDEVSPDRRAGESDTLNVEVGGVLCIEENRSEIGVVGILILVNYCSRVKAFCKMLTSTSSPAKPSYHFWPLPLRVPVPKILMSLPPHCQKVILFWKG